MVLVTTIVSVANALDVDETEVEVVAIEIDVWAAVTLTVGAVT